MERKQPKYYETFVFFTQKGTRVNLESRGE